MKCGPARATLRVDSADPWRCGREPGARRGAPVRVPDPVGAEAGGVPVAGPGWQPQASSLLCVVGRRELPGGTGQTQVGGTEPRVRTQTKDGLCLGGGGWARGEGATLGVSAVAGGGVGRRAWAGLPPPPGSRPRPVDSRLAGLRRDGVRDVGTRAVRG